jgi:hypothetical protein
MRGLKRNRTASVVIRGHAFIQNLRRGHYERCVDARPRRTFATAFDKLALVVRTASPAEAGRPAPDYQSTQRSPFSALTGADRQRRIAHSPDSSACPNRGLCLYCREPPPSTVIARWRSHSPGM